MPECYRCGRVQPTGELRRTSLGQVCKEGGETAQFSRCFKLMRERRAAERRERRAGRREAVQATGRAEA